MQRGIWPRILGSGAAFVALASIAVAQPAAVEKLPAAAQPAQPLVTEAPPSIVGASDGPYTIWEVISQSIFIKHAPKREWTPLYATTFFTEGWLQPQIDPPSGSGGSLRQGWIGVPDAFFNRQIIFGMYSYTQGANGRPNEQVGSFLLESPISRRWDVGFIVPYIDNLQGNGRPSATSFGDVTIENRFLVHETQDLTVSFNVNIRTPTGDAITGNDQTLLTSYFAFYKDLGYKGWSVRGAAGLDDPLNGPSANRFTTLFQSMGIGRTLFPHSTPIVGDLTPNVCFNATEALDTSKNAVFSITPGFRTHLGNDYFLLFGATIPVSANAGYRENFTVFLLKGF